MKKCFGNLVQSHSHKHIAINLNNNRSYKAHDINKQFKLNFTHFTQVLARVVVPGKEQEYTEEALVEGAQPGLRRGSGGYPTNELVHPYVKKTKVPTSTSSRSNRTKSLKSGRRQSKSQSTSGVSTHEDHPPRIGEVVNGWVVVNKTKDSISWDRWGTTSSSSSSSSSSNAAVIANLQVRNTQNENRLRSLKSSRSGVGSERKNTRGKQLIPNQEGKLVEGV